MKKLLLVVSGCWVLVTGLSAQTVASKLQIAFQQFQADPQLKYAVSSLYVIDAATGQVVFDKNSRTGMAPASTQKIVTAATAFELLGKDYRYPTIFSKRQNLHTEGNGALLVTGSFDPSFGSDRFSTTGYATIFKSVLNSLQKKNIKGFDRIVVLQYLQDNNPLPDGYIWSDIGNYFGAGTFALNWRENQYDMVLHSDKTKVDIVATLPEQTGTRFNNFLSVGAPGSGDNAYIYAVPLGNEITVRGTIPPQQNRFVISGSMSNPAKTFSEELYSFLRNNAVSFLNEKITVDQSTVVRKDSFFVERDLTVEDILKNYAGPMENDVVYTHYSPGLDSLIYWFLQKSVNLYGEALVKTLGYEKSKSGNTETGIKIIKDFWKQKGIDSDELNISDGSGLSPQNRITTHAQVEVLKYAKKQSWFSSFCNSLPEYNGMKMKSGTIKDVKGFCGYHKAANGKEYIFSFLVNNFNGASSELVGKMYRVLNTLK